MASPEKTHPFTSSTGNNSFPKINAFFDALELVVERMEKLVWKAKKLLFGVGFLLFLIYELALFGKHLLKMWGLA
jgi:hypothetical protein